MFEDPINEELSKPLDGSRISTRQQGGAVLKYLEGYDIIDTANRIFGFDGWQYETLETEVLANEMGQIAKAKVKVMVRNQVGEWISRSDIGLNPVIISKGNPAPTPDAQDMAIKGAVTDAMKRAFRTFGSQFGNSLYDKDYDTQNKNQFQGQQNNQQANQTFNSPGFSANGADKTPPAPDAGSMVCPTCGGAMTHKSGTNTHGKPYSGWFCSNRNCSPIWDK